MSCMLRNCKATQMKAQSSNGVQKTDIDQGVRDAGTWGFLFVCTSFFVCFFKSVPKLLQSKDLLWNLMPERFHRVSMTSHGKEVT